MLNYKVLGIGHWVLALTGIERGFYMSSYSEIDKSQKNSSIPIPDTQYQIPPHLRLNPLVIS